MLFPAAMNLRQIHQQFHYENHNLGFTFYSTKKREYATTKIKMFIDVYSAIKGARWRWSSEAYKAEEKLGRILSFLHFFVFGTADEKTTGYYEKDMLCFIHFVKYETA